MGVVAAGEDVAGAGEFDGEAQGALVEVDGVVVEGAEVFAGGTVDVGAAFFEGVEAAVEAFDEVGDGSAEVAEGPADAREAIDDAAEDEAGGGEGGVEGEADQGHEPVLLHGFYADAAECLRVGEQLSVARVVRNQLEFFGWFSSQSRRCAMVHLSAWSSMPIQWIISMTRSSCMWLCAVRGVTHETVHERAGHSSCLTPRPLGGHDGRVGIFGVASLLSEEACARLTQLARPNMASAKKNTKAFRKRPKRSKARVGSKLSEEAGGSASVRHIVLPDLLLQDWGITQGEFDALMTFRALPDAERVKEARKVIAESVINAPASAPPDPRFALALAESESLLKDYATLDDVHRAEISDLIQRIKSYLNDATRKRPLNALMLAAPGAGKSHFIKQLAGSMKAERVQSVTFNMATMQSADDIAQPIDELRNLKVNDRFPLLFLDEFDSDPTRYASLLPLLWDGELQIGHRDLKLGKAVIVLAGSNPTLPKTMELAAKMRIDVEGGTDAIPTGKLVDLLSRINGGVINIPDLDLRTEDRDRRVDKVCVTASLLRVRFGDELTAIPRALLRFVAHTAFRYGVRSIAHLVDMIDSDAYSKGALQVSKLRLPMDSEKLLLSSSLRLHLLDKDQSFGIVNRWKEFSRDDAVVTTKDRSRLAFEPLWWR